MIERQLPNSTGGSDSVRPDPRDKFSTWSIVLIVLTVLSQLALNNGEGLIKKVLRSKPGSSIESASTESFSQLITIDTEVKIAYFDSWRENSPYSALFAGSTIGVQAKGASSLHLSNFHATVEKALADSLVALRGCPDSIYFARRVMLLRDLVAIPPLDPVATVGKAAGMSSPLQAYELAAREEPDLARQIKGEEAFWKLNFSSPSIQPGQLASRLNQLNQYPTLLYYSLIARQELCLRAGSFGEAHRYTGLLQARAIRSIVCLAGLVALVAILFLLGIVIWIGALSARSRLLSIELRDGRANAETAGAFDRFVVPRDDLISMSERKLRAGDLLDCFAIYLLCLTGLGTVLSLLSAFVPHGDLKRLSQLELIYINIGFALFSYLGASLLALAFLSHKARTRGASLAVELGLSTKFALKNLVYGALGWGSSLVLLLLVATAAERLFHSLPAPENPASQMLSFAPNTLSRFALYGLAAIAAPFFEETFFRGVLLNSLLLRFRPGYACLITGLMFGAIHPVGVAEALSLAALGAVFAWMAYLRKSLVPSMFAHFLQNSYFYLTLYLSFALIVRN